MILELNSLVAFNSDYTRALMTFLLKLLFLCFITVGATDDEDFYYDISEEIGEDFPSSSDIPSKKTYMPINHLTISDITRSSEVTTRSWIKPSKVNFIEARIGKPVLSNQYNSEQRNLLRETRESTSVPVKKVSNTTIIWVQTTPMKPATNATPSPKLSAMLNTIAEQVRSNIQTGRIVNNPTFESSPSIDHKQHTLEYVSVSQVVTSTPKGTLEKNTTEWWPTKFVFAAPTTTTSYMNKETAITQPHEYLKNKLSTKPINPTRRPPSNLPPSRLPFFGTTKPPNKANEKTPLYSPFLVVTKKKDEVDNKTTSFTTKEQFKLEESHSDTKINLLNLFQATKTTESPSREAETTLSSNKEIEDYVYVNIWNVVDGKLHLSQQQKIPATLFGNMQFKDGAMFQPGDIPSAVMKVVESPVSKTPLSIQVTSSSLSVSDLTTRSPLLVGEGNIRTLPPSIVIHNENSFAVSNGFPEKGFKISEEKTSATPEPVFIIRPGFTSERLLSTTTKPRFKTRTTTGRKFIDSMHQGTTASPENSLLNSEVLTTKSKRRRRPTRRKTTFKPLTTVTAKPLKLSAMESLIENHLSSLSTPDLFKLLSDPSIFNGTHLTITDLSNINAFRLPKPSSEGETIIHTFPLVKNVTSYMETNSNQEKLQTTPIKTSKIKTKANKKPKPKVQSKKHTRKAQRRKPTRKIQSKKALRKTQIPKGSVKQIIITPQGTYSNPSRRKQQIVRNRGSSRFGNLASGNKMMLGFAAAPSLALALPYIAPMLGRKKRGSDTILQKYRTINILPSGYNHLVYKGNSLNRKTFNRVKRDTDNEARSIENYEDYYYDAEQAAEEVPSLLSPFLTEKDQSNELPTTIVPIKSTYTKPLAVDISPFLTRMNMTQKQYYQLFLRPPLEIPDKYTDDSISVFAETQKPRKKKNKVKQIPIDNGSEAEDVENDNTRTVDLNRFFAKKGKKTSILNYFPYYAIPLIGFLGPLAILGGAGRKKRSVDSAEKMSSEFLISPIERLFHKYK
ncbi:uncharacterized protein LOC136029023 isoform X1 [Artemia franciscana]